MSHLDVTRKVPSAQEIMNQLIQAESKKCANLRGVALRDYNNHILPFLHWYNTNDKEAITFAKIRSARNYEALYLKTLRKYIALRNKYNSLLNFIRDRKIKIHRLK